MSAGRDVRGWLDQLTAAHAAAKMGQLRRGEHKLIEEALPELLRIARDALNLADEHENWARTNDRLSREDALTDADRTFHEGMAWAQRTSADRLRTALAEARRARTIEEERARPWPPADAREEEALAQALADAEQAGRDSILDAAVWCPGCGHDLEDWRGHRTDPPCPYDDDTGLCTICGSYEPTHGHGPTGHAR